MDRDHLDVITDPELINLFVAPNFRFVTQAPGRPPSLYFADAQGNAGRIRQGHGGGPELDFIAAGNHLTRVYLTQVQMNQMQNNPANTPAIIAGGSAVPFAGAYVFEYAGNWDAAEDRYDVYDHLSGGTVVLGQPMPQFDLDDYANVVNRW